MTLETLGERIVHIRGDMSQEELAQRLGISRKTLIRYEKNENEPGASVLMKLVSIFGIDSQWLLFGEEESSPELTPKEAALLDNFRHCPEDEQEAIVKTSALFAQREDKKGKKVKKAG